MEEVFPRVPQTDIPRSLRRAKSGKGRVVYFPWDIDRTSGKCSRVDH